MGLSNPFKRVLQVPTNPDPTPHAGRAFDVADLYRGPLWVEDNGDADPAAVALDEKLPQTNFLPIQNKFQGIASPAIKWHVDFEDAFVCLQMRVVLDLPQKSLHP